METNVVSIAGNVLFDAEIRSAADNRLIPLFTTNVAFEEAQIVQSTEGYSSTEITVSTLNRDLVDNLLRESASKGAPHLRWRFGIGNSATDATWSTWQEHIIRLDTSQIIGLGNGAGYTAVITCSDLLWEIGRKSRVTARKGRISDIVREIANFYGLPAVIEPTKYEGLWVQSFVSDYDFILRRLLPRASNDKGRGNYRFYMRDNVIHFHTIDYQTSVKAFDYYASSGAQLLVGNNIIEKTATGSAGVRLVTHDPYSGIMQELLSDTDKTLRLGNTTPDFSGTPGLQKNVMYHIGSNRIDEANSITNALFESGKLDSYRIKLTIPKSDYFVAGDIINFTISPATSQTTPSSGFYFVPEVRHAIKRQSMMSEVTLTRGEYVTQQNSQNALVQLGENVVVPRNTAQGQTINLAATSSSSITKGAGNETSRRVFLDAINPSNSPS